MRSFLIRNRVCSFCRYFEVILSICFAPNTIQVADFLDSRDVLVLSSSSRSLRLNMTSSAVWSPRCANLWKDKVCVPRNFLDDSEKNHLTFFGSKRDSKRAVFHGAEELCEQHFHFRFRLAAGDFWWGRDPSLSGDPSARPMYKKFLAPFLSSSFEYFFVSLELISRT